MVLMRHLSRSFLATATLLWLSVAASAQGTAWIHGRVFAKQPHCQQDLCAVENASVTLHCDGLTDKYETSDDAGKFERGNLPEGRRFTIFVFKPGTDESVSYVGSEHVNTLQKVNRGVTITLLKKGPTQVQPQSTSDKLAIRLVRVTFPQDQPLEKAGGTRAPDTSIKGRIAVPQGGRLGRTTIALTQLPSRAPATDRPAEDPVVVYNKVIDPVGNTDADFEVPVVVPGNYVLIISCEGRVPGEFLVTKFEKTGMVSVVDPSGQQIEWRNGFAVTLEPLTPIQSDVPPQIVDTTPTLNRAFVQRSLESIPVPGIRTFDTFALMVPGVLPPPASTGGGGLGVSPGVGSPGEFSVNGLRAKENNFTIDGSDNNDEDTGTRRQGYVCLVPQSIESLSELQITTALADTRYGRNLGGQVDALSKTGNGGLHGTAYGFATDKRLNARDFFDLTSPASPSFTSRSANGAPILVDGSPLVLHSPASGKTPMTRVQAGFVIGGPLPSTDHSFFFVAFERDENHVSPEAHFAVPTVAERGVFGTGETGFRTNHDTALFPASVPGDAIFSLYPFPNNPAGPYGKNTYSEIIQGDGRGTRGSGKLSHQFGSLPQIPHGWPWTFLKDGHTMSGRYNATDETSLIPVTGGALFSSLKPRVRTQNAAFLYNRLLRSGKDGSSLGDAIRFSYGRTSLRFDPVTSQFLSPSHFNEPFLLNAPLLLNVTSPAADGALNPTRYISASSIEGKEILDRLGYGAVTDSEEITGPLGQVMISGFSPIGVDVYNFPQKRGNKTIQVGDTITYVRGSHILTGGFEVRKVLIDDSLDRNFRPLVQFNGLLNEIGGGGLPITGPRGESLDQRILSSATLAAAGVPTGMFQTIAVTPDSDIGIRYTQANFFLQDELRVRRNVKLTFGLRYEFNNDPETVDRKLEGAQDRLRKALSKFSNQDLAQALLAALPDFKISFSTDKSHFSPRVGFAWDPSSKGTMALRGGFGVYSGQVAGIVIDQSRNAFPDFIPVNTTNFSWRLNDGTASYLFNIANPTLGQFLQQQLIKTGTLNTLTPGISPIAVVANTLFNVGMNLDVHSTFPGLDLVVPQVGLKNPYAYQYGLTYEIQANKKILLRFSYVGTRGIHLLKLSTPEAGPNKSSIQFDENSPVRRLSSTFSFPFFRGSLISPQDGHKTAKIFTIQRTLFETSASSTYNSLQVEAHRMYANHLQVSTAFTYSHAIDNASDFFDNAGAFALPQDSVHSSERASSNFDAKVRSVTTFIWDLPFQEKQGGWQLSGVFTAQTGQPYTVNSAVDVNRDGNLTDRLNTTNLLFKGPSTAGRRSQLFVFPGTDPFSLLAAPGTDGAVGRNTFRALGILTLDLAAARRLRVRDTDAFVIRAEVFNFFNRTHFGVPVRILESPGFGTSVSTALPARTVQVVLKYVF